jgi:hypothetical protein
VIRDLIQYWLAMLQSWQPWHPLNHDVPCLSCARSSFFNATAWPEVPNSAIHGLITAIEGDVRRSLAYGNSLSWSSSHTCRLKCRTRNGESGLEVFW